LTHLPCRFGALLLLDVFPQRITLDPYHLSSLLEHNGARTVTMKFLCGATALGAVLWCSTSFGAVHTHKSYHSRHDLNSRDDLRVNPFQVAITVMNMEPNTTALATKPKNVTAYLIGSKPDSADPNHMQGFIAQHQSDESTTYYVPNNTSSGHEIAASVPDLSWKVEASNGASFKTPGTIVSGRIYIADGSLNFYAAADTTIIQPDPHNPSDISSKNIWGFVELTHSKGADTNEAMVVNLSYVDWVSLPLGMNVTFQDGDGQKTVSVPGLNPDGLINICKAMSELGSFWPRLCLKAPDGTPLRVMSPTKYLSLYPNDQDVVGYYEPYVSKVWDKYKSTSLRINTQADTPGAGSVKVDNGQVVTCRVKDDLLQCDNEAGTFVRPVSKDIYGCDSGPFANPTQGTTESWSRARVRPRLCAAFVRSTLLLDGAQPSPDISPEQYYKDNITNHYARLVHENLIGGRGYAFAYDDVNSNSSVNTAGLISITRPSKLDIFINT
jgi:hypothetical protein